MELRFQDVGRGLNLLEETKPCPIHAYVLSFIVVDGAGREHRHPGQTGDIWIRLAVTLAASYYSF